MMKPALYYKVAPTNAQAIEIFWADLKRQTDLPGIRGKKPSETRHEVYLRNGSVIKLASMEAPERIEGKTQPVGGIHLTETDECEEEDFQEHIIQTLGDSDDSFLYADGTPNGGQGWYYQLALDICGGVLPTRNESIKGAYHYSTSKPPWSYWHWYQSDVQPPERIALLKANLCPRLFDQEVNGDYVNIGGTAYYGFSQANLCDYRYNPALPIHIGMDFNVGWMCAVFFQIIGNKVYQFGEAYLIDSNTPQMINHILNELRFPVHMCTVYPDASSASPHTNAAKTDLYLLRQAGFQISAPHANPPVRDRIASVNNMLSMHRWMINPKCKRTTMDLTSVTLHQDGRLKEEEKKKGLTHISDAAGYFFHRMYPMKDQQKFILS